MWPEQSSVDIDKLRSIVESASGVSALKYCDRRRAESQRTIATYYAKKYQAKLFVARFSQNSFKIGSLEPESLYSRTRLMSTTCLIK